MYVKLFVAQDEKELQEWAMQNEVYSSNEMSKSTVLVNPPSSFDFMTPLITFQSPVLSVMSPIQRLNDIAGIY